MTARAPRTHRLALICAVGVALLSLAGQAQATPPLPQDEPVAPLPAGYTGDVIVKFTSDSAAAKGSSGRSGALKAASRRAGMSITAGDRRGLANQARLVSGGDDPVGLIKALRARADVEYAEPDRRVVAATNDPKWSQQWALHSTPNGLSVESAWTRTKGAGSRVAVIDSGKTAHPDLNGRWIGGYDFITDLSAAGDGNGRDADATDVGDFCDGEPSSWHGTSVAGTIAAITDNGREIAGVAPAAQVVPVRLLGRCGGTVSDLIDAMIWASGGTVTGVPANQHPARVVNLSVSSQYPSSCTPALQDAINRVRARGALIVVAAGNSSSPAANYEPGNCSGVMTVAASTINGTRASYSNYGGPVDLAAPGGDGSGMIQALGVNANQTNNGLYDSFGTAGTSTAAPHVSAVAALVLAANPSLTLAQLETVLTKSTKGTSCNQCGAGVLDAGLAVNSTPMVTSINFSQTGLDGGEIVLNGGGLEAVSSIKIGGLNAPVVSRVGDSSIVVTAPPHAAPGRYRVEVSNGVLNYAATLTVGYVDVPRVLSLSATSAPSGSSLTITGTGFLPGAEVDFGGIPALVRTITPTAIIVTVPSGTVGGRTIVHVSTSRGTSSASKGSIFIWR